MHTIPRRLFAAAALAALFTVPVRAATLQDLIDNNGTIVVGNKTFSDFGYSTALGCGPSAATINITGVVWNQYLEGIKIVGPLITSGTCDVSIEYKVTATGPQLIKDIGASFVAHQAGSGGIIGIDEAVWDGGFGLGNEIGHSSLSLTDTSDPLPEPGDLLDWSLTYGPKVSIWVQKDIALVAAADPGSQVGATTINQQFSQVPEPAHTALALLGATALGAMVIKRRRA